ncbi:MAG TPA: glycosyltransferase family 2 protein [Candidatus Angelobacter sp.]|nr:glycosyltransferase family 2 protein [Candidatus Angelobacter sp.]
MQLISPHPRIAVMVLNYNGVRFILPCLDSLTRQSLKRFKILVIDNGSTDGSIDLIRERYPQIEILKNGRNLGFAEANNVGIRRVLDQTDYVMLLNNDTVLEPDAIERMVNAAESDNSIGIVGPLIRDLDSRDKAVELGLGCDVLGYPINNLCALISDTAPHPFYVAGCAMMIKSDVITTIGYLDPSYFIFVEDLDFCWRARLAGFEILAVPTAIVYHKSGGTVPGGVVRTESHVTTSFRLYLTHRNRMKTILKNYGSLYLTFFLPCSIISGALTFFFGAAALGQINVVRSYLRAMWSNVKEAPITLSSRISTQALRKTSDRQIISRMSKKCSLVQSYLKIRSLIVH